MDEQTVEQVATEVEEALYRLFNKDVGTKYKNKYRTLIFNIKDPKNLGLFRKIIEKQITPGKFEKFIWPHVHVERQLVPLMGNFLNVFWALNQYRH